MENEEKYANLKWQRGRLLLTTSTARWTPEDREATNKAERCKVYALFTEADAGRGRILIKTCGSAEEAQAAVDTHNKWLAEASRLVVGTQVVVHWPGHHLNGHIGLVGTYQDINDWVPSWPASGRLDNTFARTMSNLALRSRAGWYNPVSGVFTGAAYVPDCFIYVQEEYLSTVKSTLQERFGIVAADENFRQFTLLSRAKGHL
jgi:hypothetical protein